MRRPKRRPKICRYVRHPLVIWNAAWKKSRRSAEYVGSVSRNSVVFGHVEISRLFLPNVQFCNDQKTRKPDLYRYQQSGE